MSSSSHPPAPARHRRRASAGFTLIELLVALVIAGLLTTALWQLVRSQSSFVAFESQREDAQENGRAALEIIAADVRAVLPQGILVARDTALVLALPKAWGVVCSIPGLNQMIAAFPALSTDAFTVLSNGGTGLMVNSSTTSTPAWSPRPKLDSSRPQVTSIAASAATNCPTAAGSVGVYQVNGSNFPSTTAGSLVVLYQLVRYDVGQSEGKWWVRRSNGFAGGSAFTMNPLAGPIPAADSLRFTYFSGATATQLGTAPGTDTTALNALSRVKLKVSTVSSSSYRGRYGTSRDSAVILLRNRTRSLSCASSAPSPC